MQNGCDNFCTYCAIPYIRGRYESRKFEDIIEEAKQLADNGIEEVILIAQDTTKYGIDLYGKYRLAELLREICKIERFHWVRFLYAYPESITDELIETVKSENKICNYFDIPIQHFSDSILDKMNRKTCRKNIKLTISKIREQIPDCIIRTSIIVGFPGESEDDFRLLKSDIEEVKFDRLGCFSYSKEDGTPAAKFNEQIHPKTKEKRKNEIMNLQRGISENKMKLCMGDTLEVLIEGVSDDEMFFVGRCYSQIPDMDGCVYVSRVEDNLVGKFVNVKIVGYEEYDLYGEIVL